jgi:ribonuclease BN (tRNA processing enzyme)
MRPAHCILPAVFVLLFTVTACAQTIDVCPAPQGVALQVLGSGGPIADDGRASASYIVWVDGKSRILIDAGGGSFLRFGEAGANFKDLDFIGLSHFHTDHSADFPALLKSGFFSGRKRSLALAGPGPGGPFPGLGKFLEALLNPEFGAYGYLSGYRNGSGGLARLEPVEIATSSESPSVVYEDSRDDITIEAIGVPHGIVPALGFKVRVGNVVMVFASDQNGTDSRFVDFASDANVLIMHMVIPEGASDSSTQLHAPPSVIGEIAAAANVNTLLLSHFMARSLSNFEENLAAVRSGYEGQIVVAEDLKCLVPGAK